MSLDSATTTVTHGGLSITSTDPEADIRAALEIPAEVVETKAEAVVDEKPAEETPAVKAEPVRDAEGKFTRKDWQKRVDKLTFEAREAQRERDALRAEVDTLKAPKVVEKPAEPKAATFPKWDAWSVEHAGEDYESYLDARAEFRADQKVQAALEADRAERQKEKDADSAKSAEARTLSTLEKLDALGRKAHADFRDVMEALADQQLPFTPVLAGIIAEELDGDTPLGHEFAYHLATHPDDLRRLNAYPNPVTAAREAQKILDRLSSASRGSGDQSPAVSQAKPPIKPIGSGPSAASDADPDESESFARYMERENARERKAAGLR